MNKTILAAGVGTLLFSPIVSAEMTWYGKAHLAIVNADPDSGDSELDLVSNASRLGVKGMTKISDDLSAVYKMEFDVDLDGEGDDFFNARNLYAGLKGSFGTLFGGRHDTPVKQLEGKIDLFGDTVADFGNVFDFYVDSQERENRFLGYDSPDMSGFKFKAATMPGKEADAELGDAYSLSLTYGDPKMKKTPFYVGVGYDDEVDGKDTSVVRLAASVKFGDIGLGTILENADDGDDDQTRYMFSAYYKIGHGKIKGQYVYGDDVGSKDESDLWALGYEHDIGGGTSVYAFYAERDLGGEEVDFTSVGFIYKF